MYFRKKTKLLYGTGVNDADYAVFSKVKGKNICCPFYLKWQNILKRCYCETFIADNPAYQGCKVCIQWLYFSKFKDWMETQDWVGKEPDKDLLGDGKLYSPETVVFVSKRVNLFTTDSGATRGGCPIGVSKHGKRFKAQISGTDNRHIGVFDTPEEAHAAWKAAKIKIGNEIIASLVDEPRVVLGLKRYLASL